MKDTFYPVVTKNKTRAFVDKEDYEKVSRYKWSDNGHGYLVRMSNKKMIFLHHEIIGKHEGMCIDHIDRNKLNNRRSNLRIVSKSVNTHNSTYTRGKSKYRGVSWFSPHNRWRARIRINNVDKYIGEFRDELEAKLAVDKVREELIA